jgi:hypothetical protein
MLHMGCFGGSEVIGDLGGSEVVGNLITEDEQPVEGADVRAVTVTMHENEGATVYDTTNEIKAVSNKNGYFEMSFKEKEIQEYILIADKGDSLIIKPKSFTPDSTRKMDLGTITMVKPGAISGIVKAVGADSTVIIYCSIAELSVTGIAGPATGRFLLNGLLPDTVYTVTFDANDYLLESVHNVPVAAGEIHELPDTVFLSYKPDAPPPPPKDLSSSYDTTTGTLTLWWSPVPVSDVSTYVVRYMLNGTVLFDTTFNDMAQLAIYENPLDSIQKNVIVQVAALDDHNNLGQWGESDTLQLPPPGWIAFRMDIEADTGQRSGDTIPVRCTYSSRFREAVTITWYADHPDSVVDSTHVDGLKEGTNELRWVTTTSARKLYAAITDNTGHVWVDSVDAYSLLPIDLWEVGVPMSEKRRYAGACAINGKIYVFGGCKETYTMMETVSLEGLRSAEVFDPVEKTWTTIAPMNSQRYKAAYAVSNNKIYVFGGMKNTASNNTTIECYNPETDVWEIIGTMDNELVGAAACVIDDRIFVSGGAVDAVDGKVVLSDAVRVYDPGLYLWTAVDVLSEPRLLHQMVVADSFVIVLGGLKYDTYGAVALVPGSECFIPGESHVCTFHSIGEETTRFGFGAVVIGRKLVLLGGMNSVEVGQLPMDNVNVLSLDTMTATSGQDMPVALEGFSTVELNGRVYIIGGRSESESEQKSSSAVYIYYP